MADAVDRRVVAAWRAYAATGGDVPYAEEGDATTVAGYLLAGGVPPADIAFVIENVLAPLAPLEVACGEKVTIEAVITAACDAVQRMVAGGCPADWHAIADRVPGHGTLARVVMEAVKFVLREYKWYGAVLAGLPNPFLFRDHVGKAIVRQAYSLKARHLLCGNYTRAWTDADVADTAGHGGASRYATDVRLAPILPIQHAYQPSWRINKRDDSLVSGAWYLFRQRIDTALLSLAGIDSTLGGVLAPGGPFVVCGGAVLRAVVGADQSDGDVDVFLTGREDPEACILAAVDKLLVTGEAGEAGDAIETCLLLVTRNALSVVRNTGQIVQFVLRSYGRPPEDGAAEHVLCNFDLACCQFAYDGASITCTEAAATAMRTGVNVADILQQSRAGRAFKYHQRGFAYVVPCPDRSAMRAVAHRLTGALEDASPEAQAWMRGAVRGAGLAQVLAWTVDRKLWPERDGDAAELLDTESALYSVLRDPRALLHPPALDAARARFPTMFAEVVPRGAPLAADVAGRLAAEIGKHMLVDDPTLRCFDGMFYDTGLTV